MKTYRLFFASTIFVSQLCAQDLPPIFDGQTFTGWEQRGGAVWKIQNGVIAGQTGNGEHGWLVTRKSYGDFRLELELKISQGNSGIQIRSHLAEPDKMIGYQIEIDPSPRAWSGGLYEQGRRGWLQNLTNNEPARAAFKIGAWNHYRIECVGASIKSWVNGVAAADYVDAMELAGNIALQVHSGKNCQIEFRNLRLADLGHRQWHPLWDGKTFTDWRKAGSGDWKITDGMIVARHQAEDPAYGHLISERVFTNFTVRLKYKVMTGNSGLYFRMEEKDGGGLAGFQAEIDAVKDVGGLYESGGRGWVAQPQPEDVKKWFQPQDWNTMTVSAHGRRVTVDVNGFRTAELRDDPGRTEGRLALQLHGTQNVEIYFKDIEILGEAELHR